MGEGRRGRGRGRECEGVKEGEGEREGGGERLREETHWLSSWSLWTLRPRITITALWQRQVNKGKVFS